MKGSGMGRKMIWGLAIWSLVAAGGAEARQSARLSIWDGVYTEDQAARGNTQFQQHCGRCHGANLAGTFETPPLVGRFIPYWAGTTLDVLFDYVSTAMPLDHPGSLGPGANADIIAFILKTNGFPAGMKELSAASEEQKAITFDAAPPSAAKPKHSAKAR
jgi:mono/diheme cytochrome c family protein